MIQLLPITLAKTPPHFLRQYTQKICTKTVAPESCIGLVDETISLKTWLLEKAAPPHGSVNVVRDNTETIREYVKPSLEQMANVFDFESVAANVMTEEGWGTTLLAPTTKSRCVRITLRFSEYGLNRGSW